MITWAEFEKGQPALAAAGRGQLYVHGLGLGFLATVRADGGPRVHPVCPVVSPAGLHMVIQPGPKLRDLRRDPRYSMHSETVAPPREDDAFALSGQVTEIADPGVRAVAREQFLADRDGQLWPGFDDHVLFELLLERCLLTLTTASGEFTKGHTTWKAP
jgi:hypothetical protein